jgi:hypothetical protein
VQREIYELMIRLGNIKHVVVFRLAGPAVTHQWTWRIAKPGKNTRPAGASYFQIDRSSGASQPSQATAAAAGQQHSSDESFKPSPRLD